jgi:hypothetical protein
VRLQVANRREYVVFEGRVIEVRLAGTGGAAVSTKINRKNAKAPGCQGAGLLPPAFLIEPAAVRENYAARTAAVEIGANASTVRSGEGNGLLPSRERSEHEREQQGASH